MMQEASEVTTKGTCSSRPATCPRSGSTTTTHGGDDDNDRQPAAPLPARTSLRCGDDNEDEGSERNGLSIHVVKGHDGKDNDDCVTVGRGDDDDDNKDESESELLNMCSWSLLSRFSSSTRRTPLLHLASSGSGGSGGSGGDDDDGGYGDVLYSMENKRRITSCLGVLARHDDDDENDVNSSNISRTGSAAALGSSRSWLSLMIMARGGSSNNSHGDEQEESTFDLKTNQENVTLDTSNLLWCDPITRTTRPIWIVTTASLPWMTGTAINPLLRAAALLTRLLEHQQQQREQKQQLEQHEQEQDQQQQPIVTLVVPWLETCADRIALYGEAWSAQHPTRLHHEAYIRQWLREKTKFVYAAQHLRIAWYSATYHAAFYSVLPTRDICLELYASSALLQQQQQQQQSSNGNDGGGSCIRRRPRGRAVCILEEPERLTWFRQPPLLQQQTASAIDATVDATATTAAAATMTTTSTLTLPCSWYDCFEHVIGVVHTNYQAYAATAAQYGGGSGGNTSSAFGGSGSGASSFLSAAGPFLTSLSSQLVRAYCDKIIKLSPVLPSYVGSMNHHSYSILNDKEITCNVHGIRDDFFLDNVNPACLRNNNNHDHCDFFVCDDECSHDDAVGGDHHEISRVDNRESTPTSASARRQHHGVKCYFVGKLLWAKGLDKLLEMQDEYKNRFGEYFDIDVYGSGPDEEEIQQIYRDYHHQQRQRSYRHDVNQAGFSKNKNHFKAMKGAMQDVGNSARQRAFLGKSWSLTSLSTSMTMENDSDDDNDNGIAVRGRDNKPLPVRFLGRQDHASISLALTTKSETDQDKDHENAEKDDEDDSKDYTVFVNPSVTEVLCTTTAEALAMQRFVIIPKHASNEFFTETQTKRGKGGRLFVNCLSYKDADEFCTVLDYALSHTPRPLSLEARHVLTWEAATERFLEASIIRQPLPQRQSQQRSNRKEQQRRRLDETRRLRNLQQEERIRNFHYDLAKAGHSMRQMFHAWQRQQKQQQQESHEATNNADGKETKDNMEDSQNVDSTTMHIQAPFSSHPCNEIVPVPVALSAVSALNR